MKSKHRYEIIIYWSEEDEAYITLKGMSGATKEIGAPENRISEFQEELCPDAPGTMISNPEFGPVVTARQ